MSFTKCDTPRPSGTPLREGMATQYISLICNYILVCNYIKQTVIPTATATSPLGEGCPKGGVCRTVRGAGTVSMQSMSHRHFPQKKLHFAPSKIVNNSPPKGVKKGQKLPSRNPLFSRYHLLTKFYPSSYQILPIFYLSKRWSEIVNNFFRRGSAEGRFRTASEGGRRGWRYFFCLRAIFCAPRAL